MRITKVCNHTIDVRNSYWDDYDAGTIALVWATSPKDPRKVYGRGIRKGGTSCVFQGQLELGILGSGELSVGPAILSPEMYPVAPNGKNVFGYEDPSVILYGPWRGQIFCTQAYHVRGRDSRLATNLIRFDGGRIYPVADPKTVLTYRCETLAPRWRPDMVKELNMVPTPAHREREAFYQRVLVEVGAKTPLDTDGDGHSRIMTGELVADATLKRVTPFFEPTPGTWYDNHVSTASHALPLGHGLSLLVFNGAKKVWLDDERRYYVNHWAVGLMVLNAYGGIVWVSPEPIILPPEGVEPGPNGQLIAFGSDARIVDCGKGAFTLSVLYHAMDRYPCYWHGHVHVGW